MIFSLRNKLSIIIICLSIIALIILPYQVNDGGSSFFGGAQLIPNLTLSLIIILSFVDLVINGFFSFIKKKDHNFLISNWELQALVLSDKEFTIFQFWTVNCELQTNLRLRNYNLEFTVRTVHAIFRKT